MQPVSQSTSAFFFSYVQNPSGLSRVTRGAEKHPILDLSRKRKFQQDLKSILYPNDGSVLRRGISVPIRLKKNWPSSHFRLFYGLGSSLAKIEPQASCYLQANSTVNSSRIDPRQEP